MVTRSKKIHWKLSLFDFDLLIKKVARNRSKILKNLSLFNLEVLCFKKSLYSTSISKAAKKEGGKSKKRYIIWLKNFFKSLFFLRTQERVEKTTRNERSIFYEPRRLWKFDETLVVYHLRKNFRLFWNDRPENFQNKRKTKSKVA